MKNLFTTAAALATMSIGSATHAQGSGDWYVSVFAGYSSIGSVDTDFNGFEVEHEFDDNGIFGVSVGRALQPGLRAEVELSYAQYDGGDVSYDGSLSFDETNGELSTTFLMGNIWYDVPTASFGGGVPYIGAGLGAVQLDADTTFGGFPFGYGDTVTGLAYQIGAGVQFPVGAGMIDVAYRLKAASGLDIDDNDGSGVYEDGTFLSNNLQIGYVTQF
ncbi:acyloxyacyl hydrolase [Yoonia sp. BS5-3]|uniref:Outer membrane protein n=1 Tax=Yoonia phaeophyticola TaxID=3137369 RepID=A0ABZ2V076_9RHOB